ncbi:MAG: motility associated factor glycosyltransferase family protein [Bacteroidales bacterium]
MGEEELLAKNLAVFERHFPTLHARIQTIGTPISRIIYDGAVPADVDLGDARLYGGDGRVHAAQQVEAYIRSPMRVGYLVPRAEQFDSMLSRRFHTALMDAAAAQEVGELSDVPVARTGYLFILGVGLGYHLRSLIEQTDVPHILICEAFEEFLLASMKAIDWGELVELCEQRGATLQIVCTSAADRMMREAIDWVDICGPVYLDGSHFFQHYGSWVFEEARRRLINELPRQMFSRGYFEDERKMVRNFVANFQKANLSVLDANFRPRQPIPVFIIAAGPSLDEAIPYIKQWREHALVFSAGSGLQPCLRNGIIPDFHVEVENTYWVYGKIEHILSQNRELFPEGRFTGINFIGSTTVNPALLPLFDRHLYFFRDSATPSLCFGQEFGLYTGAAPTVANTATSVIARMGLGDVYLFGVDCGWRDQFTHHSRDTIYYTADTFRNEKMSGAYAFPGNFGGTIYSDAIFDWCRNMLEQAFAAFHMTVFNCSDGALIRGATPLVPEALHFDGEPLDRNAVIDQILASRPTFSAGEFFSTRRMEPYLQQLKMYEDMVMPLVDMAMAEDWEFSTFHDKAWTTVGGEASDRGLGMAAWIQCSTVGALKQSAIVLNRIADPNKRQVVARAFYAEFKQVHQEMFAEAEAMLREIDSWIVGGPEPEWTDGVARVPGVSY